MAKNDFFENLKTWEEQRLEEEARIRAEETARKLALLEAERERAEKEALEALFRQKAKEEEARRLEQERLSGLEKDRADKMLLPLLGITVVLVAIAALSLFRQSRRRPVRRRR
ncbi:MAG: hypothetical protein IKD31_03560 [Clostridia bacterium]|nr:hypothetical protein [Clostridia bacterium]